MKEGYFLFGFCIAITGVSSWYTNQLVKAVNDELVILFYKPQHSSDHTYGADTCQSSILTPASLVILRVKNSSPPSLHPPHHAALDERK
jgi:hypothetical protein